MTEMEKRGIPTVAFTAKGFFHDARRSGQNFGMPNVSLAVMPVPFTNQPADVIEGMVDAIVDDVIKGLTEPLDVQEKIVEVQTVADEVLRFDGVDQIDAWQKMNRQFREYMWSDGFPLAPATQGAVEEMLKGTTRSPYDIIATLEPGFGLATVEKIAINCVMAGCLPEHLPILIAAVQCIAEPKINLRNKAMSTGPHAPLIFVNGPIAKEVKINSGVCVLGPGSRSFANVVIGRALRLIMMNIGATYPGVSDMDTIGSPTKFSMCAAENEDESPWEPYHVEKGFSKDTSTVTVQFTYGIAETHDFVNYEPEKLAEMFAGTAMNLGILTTAMWLIGRRADPRYNADELEHNFMFICPEHAHNFAKAGWDKPKIREYMYKNTMIPFKKAMLSKERAGMMVAHPELQWLWDAPDTLVPIVETPECFELAVVGGFAGRGCYHYGAGGPVTKVVEK